MATLDIAVAGCGPGRLAAALMLHRDGHRVRLSERFEAARPIGSGLMIQPTGRAVLRHLGLDAALAGRATRIERLFGQAGGRIVLDVRYAALADPGAYGLGVHRAALFEWAPLDEQADATNPDVNWRPPANPGASASAVIDWLLHLALLVLRHGFAMLFVGIFGPVAIGALLTRTTGGPKPARIAWALPVIAALVANLVFGDALATRLLHRFGTAAVARVTGSYGTSVQSTTTTTSSAT